MPDFQWDPVRRVYIKPNGKIVTPAEQRKLGLRITAKSAEALEALTETFTRRQNCIRRMGHRYARRRQGHAQRNVAACLWRQRADGRTGSAGCLARSYASNTASLRTSCSKLRQAWIRHRQGAQHSTGNQAGSATRSRLGSARSMPECRKSAASSSLTRIIARNAFRKLARAGSQSGRLCR